MLGLCWVYNDKYRSIMDIPILSDFLTALNYYTTSHLRNKIFSWIGGERGSRIITASWKYWQLSRTNCHADEAIDILGSQKDMKVQRWTMFLPFCPQTRYTWYKKCHPHYCFTTKKHWFFNEAQQKTLIKIYISRGHGHQSWLLRAPINVN